MALLMVGSLSAQQLKANHGKVTNGYNFWLYTPEGYVKDSTAKPLIIFLHGKSLCGHDLNRVRRYGSISAVEMGMKIDAIIMAPQNPGGSWNPEKIMNVMKWVERHYTVDTNRVYVLGMSMGGYGTINFAGTYPDKVAAAMALCGGGTIRDLCGLNDLPLWILHGTADRAVPISASQKVVDAMNRCGQGERLIWTRLQGMNHGSLARAFYLPQTYEWLFSHSLADTNRPVNRSYVITPTVLSRDAYRFARQGGKVVVSQSDHAADSTELAAAALADSAALADANNTTVEQPHNKKTSKTKATSTAGRKYHTVKKGDTLGAIARKYHTSVKKLCQLNGIKSTTTLKIGRKLRVK